MRPFTKQGLSSVTAAAMATSTFPVVVVSVLAAQLIGEFDITRAQVGLLVTANAVVGALLSPTFGRLTDRFGGYVSVLATLVCAGTVLVGIALSPTYGFLIVVALFAGIPNGWGNPATNALLVDNVAPGERGVVTGIKQSGVQFGNFLGGLLLPIFTSLWSWRAAILAFLAVPAGGILGLVGRESRRHVRTDADEAAAPLPVSVRWVAAYGLTSGLVTSSMVGFLPLFAQEDQEMSAIAAGSMVAVVGLVGIIARIVWARASERKIGHGPTLRILSGLTVVSVILLTAAALDFAPSWVLFPAAVLLGAGAMAWNAVGMLAVMEIAPPRLVGRGTGLVLFGFLIGVATGPPLLGLSVDTFGSYAPGWAATGVLLSISMAIARKVPGGATVTAR